MSFVLVTVIDQTLKKFSFHKIRIGAPIIGDDKRQKAVFRKGDENYDQNVYDDYIDKS